MAHDEDLGYRLREILSIEDGLSENQMFGGLAFLIHANMTVSASSQGGLLLRVDPAKTDKLLTRAHAQPFLMREQEMSGWLRIDPAGIKTKRDLQRRGCLGVEHARALPPKRNLRATR